MFEKINYHRHRYLRRIALWLVAVVMVSSVVAGMVSPTRPADAQTVPVLGDKIPSGYRDWSLISVAREKGNLNDIRAKLGNDVAIKAYREEKLPFPDGTIIARLAWNYVPSEDGNRAFGNLQSFVAGLPKEKEGVQFMVKDSSKYASTGGWGYAQFNDGKPGNVAAQNTCFSCHAAVKDRDFVFTRYAP